MTCSRCSGLMAEDRFFDFEGTQGFMSMECWRCINCGHAQDAVAEQSHLARQEKVLALTSGEPDYQDDDVHLGSESFVRRAA